MTDERRLVFVSWDTGIIDRCDSDVVVMDLEAVGYVPDGDDYLDSGRVEELARENGVPVAELWAAYQWRQKILEAMGTFDEWCPVGELSGERHKYPAGDGVVIPWDVAGDPRTGVEACRGCVSVIDQDYDNAHRCESCGVTGGGVENGLCDECAHNRIP